MKRMGVACLILSASCALIEPPPEPKPFPKDAFEWPSAPARVGEKFSADLKAKKPISTPYRIAFCRVDEGELPAGLRQDADHIEGIPLKAGEWSGVFRVQLAVGPEERRVVQYVPWKIVVEPSIETRKDDGILEEIREMRRLVKELRDLVRQAQTCIRAR